MGNFCGGGRYIFLVFLGAEIVVALLRPEVFPVRVAFVGEIEGHAEALELDRSSTRILLHDGAIDLQDVLTHHLAAGLVVLNACSGGGDTRGYGVGLGDALLLEGAGAVLTTVEPVADAESTRFLGRFFEGGPDVDPGEAFRDAVRASVDAKDDVWRRYRLWAR